jgi:transposase
VTKELSIDQLQALVKQLEQDNKSLLKDNGKLKKNAKEMQRQIDLLISKLNLSNSKRFGKQSEKAPRGTFNEAESTKSATEPKHHNKGKQNLPEHLEREEVEHKLEDTNCGCCGHQMHVCGSEESEQIKIIPAKISVIKHKQLKYACRECEHTQIKNKVVTASKPKQPIPRSIASPEALAAVVTAKYCDALPLYRQVEIFKRGGLDFITWHIGQLVR